MHGLSPREQTELEEKIKAFIDQAWIEPSVSGWSSSVLFIPKPGGKLRFCVDNRRLKAVTQLDKSPIPLQAEMLDHLQRCGFFLGPGFGLRIVPIAHWCRIETSNCISYCQGSITMEGDANGLNQCSSDISIGHDRHIGPSYCTWLLFGLHADIS